MALSRERRRKRRTPRTDEELEEDQEPLPVSKKVRYGSRRDKLIARFFCPCHAPPPNKGECWDMGTRLGHVIRLASEPLEFGRSFD